MRRWATAEGCGQGTFWGMAGWSGKPEGRGWCGFGLVLLSICGKSGVRGWGLAVTWTGLRAGKIIGACKGQLPLWVRMTDPWGDCTELKKDIEDRTLEINYSKKSEVEAGPEEGTRDVRGGRREQGRKVSGTPAWRADQGDMTWHTLWGHVYAHLEEKRWLSSLFLISE